MSEEIANQSEESPIEVERDADTEALYESFGMPAQKQEKKDVEFPNMDEPTGEPLTMEEENEVDPEEPPAAADKRTIKVKYNGEDKEIGEDEAPTLIQKGMNYDKVQQKLTEQQQAMDEVAQLQGFKDHADLIANLPKLREQQQQKEQDDYQALRDDLRAQAEDAGLDPDRVEAWLDNHPLMKEAVRDKQVREAEQLQRTQEEIKQQTTSKWQLLYQKYPHLLEDGQAFSREERPNFFTDEMKSRYERGYDPIDAFELAHQGTLATQTKKAAEQSLIKQQQLGFRGQVNSQTATPPDEASLLPVQMSLAEEFGVSVKGVQRQNQLLKSRR